MAARGFETVHLARLNICIIPATSLVQSLNSSPSVLLNYIASVRLPTG